MRKTMQQLKLQSNISIADIPPQPDLAIDYLLKTATGINAHAQLCLMGSSLGGFYATWLAEQFDCKAVLINPAVRAHHLLQRYIGENQNYHTGASWYFEQAHIEALKSINKNALRHPDNYYVLLQTGDETLDYTEAKEYYQQCHLMIEQGGDHAFQGFDSHIVACLKFCGFQLASN